MSNKNESKREERVKTPPTLGWVEVRVFYLPLLQVFEFVHFFVEEDHLFFESEHCTPKIKINQRQDTARQDKTKQNKAREDRKDKPR
jgi:hypothetical protein